MQVTRVVRDDVVVFELEGSLDARTAPAVQAQLLPGAEGHDRIVLDLSRTEYVSSGGIRMLLLVYRQIKGRGGRIVLAGLSEPITDVLTNTGLIGFFTTVRTAQDGLDVLRTTSAS